MPDPWGGDAFTLARKRVTVSSFSDDAIQSVIETWADGVPALAKKPG